MSNLKQSLINLGITLGVILVITAPLAQCGYDNWVKYKMAKAAEKVSKK